jgi:hypothetical protein
MISVASAAHILLFSHFNQGYGAGPFDGDWNGSATAMIGQCKPALVTLTVVGRVVTGRATFERGAQEIRGTVWESGTFGATIGFQPVTGRFANDMFEGSFDGFGCAWKMTLRLKKLP